MFPNGKGSFPSKHGWDKNNDGEKNVGVNNWGSVPGSKSIVNLHLPKMTQNKLINSIFRDFCVGGIGPPLCGSNVDLIIYVIVVFRKQKKIII